MSNRRNIAICLSESLPQLHMNKTYVHVKLGDSVNVSCSITYYSQLKVTLTLTEASRTINVSSSQTATDRPTFTVSVTVGAMTPQFGPFRCLAVFTPPDNRSDEFAHNSVELHSDEIEALRPACTFSNFQLSVMYGKTTSHTEVIRRPKWSINQPVLQKYPAASACMSYQQD